MLEDFTSTDLQRDPVKVYDAVKNEEVVIRRQSHNAMILMTKKRYLELMSKAA